MVHIPLLSNIVLGLLVPLMAATPPLEGPKPYRRDRLEVYTDARGEEVLKCLESALIPPRGARVEMDRKRLLCTLADGSRLAWYWSFAVGTTGATELLLVDVEQGKWLAVRTAIHIEPRRPGESWGAWKQRYLEADPSLITVRLETDALKLEPQREKDLEQARPRWWQTLSTEQPELAAFLTRLARTVGKPGQGTTATTLIAPLKEAVLVMAEASPTNFKVTVREDKSLFEREVSEYERSFGRWASWPEPPRLRP